MAQTEAANRGVRVARAGMASALGVLVALAAHLAGGGAAPPFALLAAAAVLVQPAAVLLAGRAPRLWRQAAVVGVGQAAMHATFALGGPAAGAAPSGMAAMHGEVHLSGGAGPATGHDMAGMWLWHVMAWVATTVAWRWGEAALRALLTGIRRAVRRAVQALIPLGPVRRPSHFGRTVVPVPAARRVADPRRGPPAFR